MKKIFNQKSALVAAGLAAAAGSASAAIDTAPVTTALTEAGAACATVGAAALVVYVGIKCWKLIKQAF